MEVEKEKWMYEIVCRYVGLVPMMMDRFSDPTDTERPTKTKKKGRDEKEIAAKLHRDAKGVFVPADNLKMMLIGNQHRRGAAQILGSDIESGKGTKYRSMCEGCIWPVGPKDIQKVYIELARKTHDDVDARSFINSNGSRSMSYRPVINLPWSLTFIIQVTDAQIHESKVRELFTVAGFRCGVCAYGPTFGRCMIDLWEVVADEKHKQELLRGEADIKAPKNHTRGKSHGSGRKNAK